MAHHNSTVISSDHIWPLYNDFVQF